MKHIRLSAISLAALLSMSAAHAQLPGGAVQASASFTPANAVAGQSVTFKWNSIGASSCDVEGVPGVTSSNTYGAYTFVASTGLNAAVDCTNNVNDRMVAATLTVVSANSPPTESIAYSPSTIYVGQSATLAWSSQYATNCASTSGAPISGTSGSVTVTPAANQSTMLSCTGPGGTSAAGASLTVLPAPPAPPVVTVTAFPPILTAPGMVSYHWSSVNATSCSAPGGATSGSSAIYASVTTMIWVSCTGPGGTASNGVMVTVPIKPIPAAVTTASLAKLPDLHKLGLNLAGVGVSHSLVDLNGDGKQDLIVVDSIKREAYILINRGGAYDVIDKTVLGIGSQQELKSVFVPKNIADGIRVSTEQ